jgi:predicted ArsR family transcriptional regulator
MEALALLPNAEAKKLTAKKRGNKGTIEYICQKMGVVKAAACRYMRLLKAEDLVHIGAWNRTRGVPAAVWFAGPGEDAKPLQARSSSHSSKKHRKRIKNAVERARKGLDVAEGYKRYAARALADDIAAKSKINPQHAFSALFT